MWWLHLKELSISIAKPTNQNATGDNLGLKYTSDDPSLKTNLHPFMRLWIFFQTISSRHAGDLDLFINKEKRLLVSSSSWLTYAHMHRRAHIERSVCSVAHSGKSLPKFSTRALWIISEWWHLKSLSCNAKASAKQTLLSSQHALRRVRAIDGQHLRSRFFALAFLQSLASTQSNIWRASRGFHLKTATTWAVSPALVAQI